MKRGVSRLTCGATDPSRIRDWTALRDVYCSEIGITDRSSRLHIAFRIDGTVLEPAKTVGQFNYNGMPYQILYFMEDGRSRLLGVRTDFLAWARSRSAKNDDGGRNIVKRNKRK